MHMEVPIMKMMLTVREIGPTMTHVLSSVGSAIFTKQKRNAINYAH